MSNVFAEIQQERDRQDAKWGIQNHHPTGWMAVLMEEVGEAAQEVAQAWIEPVVIPAGETRYILGQRLRAELVQVAAVAVAAIESLDRNELRREDAG